MTRFLALGYAAFFALLLAYLLRLVVMGRRLRRQRNQLQTGERERGNPGGTPRPGQRVNRRLTPAGPGGAFRGIGTPGARFIGAVLVFGVLPGMERLSGIPIPPVGLGLVMVAPRWRRSGRLQEVLA